MSCLKQKQRIKDSYLFQKVYKNGKQFHKPSFVLFYLESNKKSFGFTSTKKIGNAVLRNRSRRLLKSVIQKFCLNLRKGLYVIVAKDTIHTITYKQLVLDFEKGIRYLKLYEYN